jgi:uncharacterized protein
VVPRSRTPRKISNLPEIKGFKPYGGNANNSKTSSVTLLLEEYEALKLCDFDLNNHMESSEIMGVSRPTFTRIYASALKKIAQAFVEGRGIIIEGGHVYFDSDWYYCGKCDSNFNNPDGERVPVECPLCGNRDTLSVQEESSGDVKGQTPEEFKGRISCGNFNFC